ncbi:MAG: proprotein convertase P-domain-containing protein, partial [Pseudomonadota bacterium]
EVVMYNGHSVLGTGMAFERAQYPDFYQIFQVASCLSYEYYVRPVLSGKGSWESVDVISNVQPTYYSENLPLTSTILAKLMQGFENSGNASWQDIMEAVSRKLGHSRFGVSGARGNCFSPEGDRCEPDPDPDPEVLRFENTTPLAIPDNDPTGVTSVIEIPGNAVISSLEVEIDLTHTYVGDLYLVLAHNGAAATLWNRTGGSDNDIKANFQVTDFNTLEAGGAWELHVVDHAGRDTGTLNGWVLVVHTGEAPDPGLEPLRYESSPAAAIPDNDATGVTSAMNVADQVTVASLAVEIDITHTYIGDLKIVLQHNGTERALWNREGGGSDDLRKTFQVTDFNGADSAGPWSLRIVDEANLDTGTLSSWALVITPGG